MGREEQGMGIDGVGGGGNEGEVMVIGEWGESM